eukprot:364388-Chlamydomonas_euryale.AAC.10
MLGWPYPDLLADITCLRPGWGQTECRRHRCNIVSLPPNGGVQPLTGAPQPPTISCSDRAIVLDDGRVVENDEPAALLSRVGGAFAGFVDRTGRGSSAHLRRIASAASMRRAQSLLGSKASAIAATAAGGLAGAAALGSAVGMSASFVRDVTGPPHMRTAASEVDMTAPAQRRTMSTLATTQEAAEEIAAAAAAGAAGVAGGGASDDGSSSGGGGAAPASAPANAPM